MEQTHNIIVYNIVSSVEVDGHQFTYLNQLYLTVKTLNDLITPLIVTLELCISLSIHMIV